ncbi:MAG: (2Fe-2S)-binding protein [Thermotogae bacterium]|uniref:(2Fe-2S)-binding protein n=1 Tax=Kosmotoga arenicorallina TaxID=688066 RepID=A0A7C5I1L7_9BACT|nr:(2Fe-2S)-binding protein [Kosmotoga sp.]MBO8166330.1 (2Fe-2S)-binding protein [Kosmotoga sp.]MCD6159958.1 (2Fe-2S)-binding protein [Kosmotoga sp.]RKX48588.1 MAG: (2Fe-2S)-binding protein [Thermotogota bacterium]HHF08228.1 (2Fe-2S)-binding protein [Kosmotoga arenicorallina]
MIVEFTLNGEKVKYDVRPDKRVLDFFRDELGLTGPKEACGEGECGACTIIVDGLNVHSCLMLAAELDGKDVWTIEGLKGPGEKLHPIQEAFVEAGAIQCGFCTPGMVMSTKVLLDNNPSPTREEIKKALEGNLCRCTGYYKIIEAVELAAEKLKGDG